MKGFKSFPVIRHLDDVDDLKQFGRDGILLPNQELEAYKYTKDLVKTVHSEGKKAVLLLCSARKRGFQTGQLISDEIYKIDPTLKVRVVRKKALENMDEGSFILPDSYKSGDKFPGLVLGKKIFNQEVFGLNPNLLYRFGDPVDLGGGNYKYPELKGYFNNYGESHRDFMVKLLKLIVETSENIERLYKNTKVVVITHSLQYQIFYDLKSIAEDVVGDNIEIRPGEIHSLCWKKYQERIGLNAPKYDIRYIDSGILSNHKIINIIKKEIDYLNNLK